MREPSRPPWAYRQLMRLLPAEMRARFGPDIGWIFTERLREARGARARARVWAAGVTDLVRHAAAERAAAWSVGSPASGTGTLGQDVRVGVRGLRRAPGFAAAAVLTLALGVGAATAVFGVVNALLLRPLPYRAADRLVEVWPETSFNTTLLARVAESVPALESMSGMSLWTLTLVDEGAEPLELDGMFVSVEHFDLLGVRAALGRTFRPEEGEPGAGDVALLSWDFWQSRYGGDASVVGRRIRLAGGEHDTRVVVGVLPPDHRPVWKRASVWVPLERRTGVTLSTDNTWWVNWRVGRLADGATIEQAQSQLRQVARAIRPEVPTLIDEESAREASIRALEDGRVGERLGTALLVLSCAVGLVLLIACVNVANLLLARGVSRQAEFALRRALGASRARIARQLLVETAVLALAGGAAALLLAHVLLAAMAASSPAELADLADVRLDLPVLVFALGLACGSALLAGVLPALRTGSADVSGLDRSASRGVVGRATGGRLSGGLVALEVALAVVLVAASGLMVRTLANLRSVDTGFEAAGVLTFRPAINGSRYPDAAAYRRYYEEVIDRVEALPGVASAAGIQNLPVTFDNWSFPLFIEDHPLAPGATPPMHGYRAITPGYLRTMGIPLLAGRGVEPTDRADSPPIVLVNRAFARRYWPAGTALGRELRVFSAASRPLTVVGVVEDVRQFALDAEPEPEIYVPHAQVPWETSLHIVARARDGDAEALARHIPEAVWSVDREVPIARLEPLERVVFRSAATTRFLTLLLGGFGVLALVLGAVGVYGVTAFSVMRRLPEYGVRLALGATARNVAAEALLRGGAPVLLGLLAGGSGAFAATRLLRGLLFGVAPTDLPTYAAATGILALVALVALLLPARRATRADPIAVLRRQ